MINQKSRPRKTAVGFMTRRQAMKRLSMASGAVLAASAGYLPKPAQAGAHTQSTQPSEGTSMSQKAFVYTELQISVPFAEAPWHEISLAIQQQPGFISKTWLAGVGNNSLGGIYSFDGVENAQKFVTGYFPAEAKKFGVAHNTRVFDATIVEDASKDINSPHFGYRLTQTPGAFVYTEVQVNVPFENAPWTKRNPVLKQQRGLIAKTWLSGLHTNTLGGIDAFDTVENAKTFALEAFPETAARLNAAFYTRVFDANITEEASRFLNSPYYS